MTKAIYILAALLWLGVGIDRALAGSFDVDPGRSTVMFKVAHPAGHLVGHFENFKGRVELDGDDRRIVGLKAEVDVSSVSTASNQRDRDLRGEGFLSANKFPTASFISKKVSEGTVMGDLSFRGKTKEITLDCAIGATYDDASGQKILPVILTGKFSRKDFGLTFNPRPIGGQPLFGDDVELTVELRGVLK